MPVEREAALAINGGLVTGLPPHLVGGAESPDCDNIDPAYPLGARTRAGSTKFGVDGPAAGSGTLLTGLFAWTRDAGTTYLFAANATTIYAVDTGSWFSVKTGMASDSIMQAVGLNNQLVVVASGLAPQISSAGSSLASITAGTYLPSLSKYVTEFVTKILMAGSPTFPSRVSFSKSNDPESWGTVNNAGEADVGTGDGDIIYGLEGTKRAAYIFKRRHTYALTGDSPFNFRIDLLCRWGLVSERAKATDGQGCFFASDDGIYYASGLQVARISDAVKTTYDDISDKSTITMEVKGEKLFVFYKGSGDSQNNRALVCAYKRKMSDGSVRGVWAYYSAQPYGVAHLSRANQLYGGTDASTLQIYELDTGSSGSINAYWNTPDLPMGGYGPKTLMRYFVHMQSPDATTTITVRHYADGASVGSDYALSFGTTGSHIIQQAAGQTSVTGYFLRLRFSWTGQKTVYGFTVYGDTRYDVEPRR